MEPLITAAVATAATVATGAAGLGWSLVEAGRYVLRHAELPVLPVGSASVRVLHLSDLHLLPRHRTRIAWVRELISLRPDLVVNTGDNLAHHEAVPAVLAAHGELLDVPGVFVLGSNDYYAPRPKNPARYFLPNGGRKILGDRLPTHDLVHGFTARGWLDLTNARGTLRFGGQLIEFVGVDDPHIARDRYRDVAGPPDLAASVSLGVVHAPCRRVLDAMAADGAAAILAGHTHGGQVRIPGVGALVTNCDLPRRQASGVSLWPTSSEAGAYLHVSAGLGTSPYTPVRFACRPEATLLTLTARS